MPWADTRERIRAHTGDVLASLHDAWGGAEYAPAFEYGPLPWHPDAPPDSLAAQREVFGGVASAVVFYTADRAETVLVYNRGGYWEPPGGVIESDQSPAEAARAEVEEETGLGVELVGLHAAGRVRLQYADDSEAELPAVTFVGHRTSGRLRVERERNDHPGVTRGVGLFDRAVLPESTRDRERVLDLFAATER